MTRALPLLALLALAACRANDPLPAPATPAEAACRAEARADPAAKSGYERLEIGNETQRRRVMGEIAAAERVAFLRCMRARGLAAPGGVEPVRPPE